MSNQNGIRTESAAPVTNNIAALQQFLGCDNSNWTVRQSEVLKYAGTTKIGNAQGKIAWQGNIAITWDGDSYRLRVYGGEQLPSEADQLLKRGEGANAWWSDRMHAYYGRVWDSGWANVLKKLGWREAKTMTMEEAKQAIPQAQTAPAKVSKPVTEVASDATQVQVQSDGSVVIVKPALPAGYVYNKEGRPMNEKTGKFASDADIEEARHRQTTQAASVPVKASELARPTGEEPKGPAGLMNQYFRMTNVDDEGMVMDDGTMTGYELGEWLGMMDRERGYEHNPHKLAGDMLDGYEEGYAPKPQVDEKAIMSTLAESMSKQMLAMQAAMLEAMNKQLHELLSK